MARGPYTEKEIADSAEVMDMLSDGNLLCSIVESRRDRDSGDTIPWEKVHETEPKGESKAFEDLTQSERSDVIREAVGYLFSKGDVDRAIEVMDGLLASHASGHAGVPDFNADKWEEIRDHVECIKSSLRTDA